MEPQCKNKHHFCHYLCNVYLLISNQFVASGQINNHKNNTNVHNDNNFFHKAAPFIKI